MVMMEASLRLCVTLRCRQMMGCAVAQSIAVCKPRNLCHLSSYRKSLVASTAQRHLLHSLRHLLLDQQKYQSYIALQYWRRPLQSLHAAICINSSFQIFNLHTHSRERPVLFVL